MVEPNQAVPPAAMERDDRVERWGRRIGRSLGWIAIAVGLLLLVRGL
jgi:hypothetical protein